MLPMKAQQDIFSHTRTRLTRHDLITYEHLLADAVGRFLSFRSYSLYFPRNRQSPHPVWDSADKKLLLPLVLHGEVLGVFVARGVSMRARKTLLDLCPAVGAMVLETLLLYKMSITDPTTGLFSRPHLEQAVCREVELIRECFRPAGDGHCDMNGSPSPTGKHHACMGVITFTLDSLRHVERDYGFVFAGALMTALADALRDCAPEQALVARTGDHEFGMFVPGGTVGSCRRIAKECVRCLRSVRRTHTLTEDIVRVAVCAGYAAYPQDFEGHLFERAVEEQAKLLLRKSRIAATIAGEKGLGDATDHVMGYHRILAEGGKVVETMPMSRIMVSLGRAVGAREGSRYAVWSTQYDSHRAHDGADGADGAMGGSPGEGGDGKGKSPLYKGEIVLMEVREAQSLAEVMHLGDPTWPIEPGDRIALVPEEKGVPGNGRSTAPTGGAVGGEAQLDTLTGLYRHRDFLTRFSRERELCDRFAVALVRLTGPEGIRSGHSHPEQIMAEAAELCRDMLCADTAGEDQRNGRETETAAKGCSDGTRRNTGRSPRATVPAQAIGGRYGLNSLIFFHPGASPDVMRERYTALCETLESRLGIEAAVGVACHPFLRYRKAESVENCLKALEYAMLCPAPHVGVMDSLALNISADKLYSQSDTFGAIEEYKRALLADADNTMARNSLGVCYAGLGRQEEARHQFTEALARNPHDVMALYNLGNVCHALGEYKEARAYYRKCLKHNPGHFFALLRLGQLSETERQYGVSRQYYTRAAKLGENQGLVQRHLARLCMRQNRMEEARECLHQALIHNPQDAQALQLMAKLYLDAGEDPEIAEVLARQAAALRPDMRSAWLELARAFEARGRHDDAREALVKAGAL